MKGASSRALRLEAPDDDFGWQDGYWARSCDPGDLDDVTRYVLRQREHHAHAAAPEPWEAASAEDA